MRQVFCLSISSPIRKNFCKMQEKCQSDKIALVVVQSLVRTAGVMENIQHYPDLVEGKYFIGTATFQ